MIQLLVVDDNMILASLTEHILTSAIPGLEGRIATSYQDAKVQILKASPDIMVLDHHLPDGEGPQLLEELPVALTETKVLMLSGESYRGEAKPEHPNIKAHLEKPFENSVLISTVEALLKGAFKTAKTGQKKPPPNTFNRHLVINQLSAVIAGLRAFAADLEAEADDPAQVRELTEEYTEQLISTLQRVAGAVRAQYSRDHDEDGRS